MDGNNLHSRVNSLLQVKLLIDSDAVLSPEFISQVKLLFWQFSR